MLLAAYLVIKNPDCVILVQYMDDILLAGCEIAMLRDNTVELADKLEAEG